MNFDWYEGFRFHKIKSSLLIISSCLTSALTNALTPTTTPAQPHGNIRTLEFIQIELNANLLSSVVAMAECKRRTMRRTNRKDAGDDDAQTRRKWL